MEDRQKDLEEVVSTGDHSRVVVLSSMLTQGAKRMLEMTRQELSDDENRSRTAPGEGRFAPIEGSAHIKVFSKVWVSWHTCW